ncbi:MMPL family transporter, partial [Streptomyces sp. NPDC088246]|uniref:MMPL family transporter n=1 Tax=Streptomyces sp. NPDC088246 TaxID=3365842 RepID=UPI00380E18C3
MVRHTRNVLFKRYGAQPPYCIDSTYDCMQADDDDGAPVHEGLRHSSGPAVPRRGPGTAGARHSRRRPVARSRLERPFVATFLYRLGRFSFRRRRLVALLWVVVLAACAFAAAKAPAAPEDGFSMPGTESQKAFDLLDQRFPGQNSNGADARIVFVAPKGQKVTAGANKGAIEKIVADVAGGSQVKGALNPFDMAGAVSKDGTTAYSTISYDAQSTDLTDATTKALED